MVYPHVSGLAGNDKRVTKERPKILFLVTEDWYFCSHRLPIACAAREAGFEVVIATHVQEHARQIIDEGLRLIPIRLRRRSRTPFHELLAVSELIRLYRRERPDLVHHVAMKPVLYGSLAARLTKTPGVVNAFAGMGYLFISSHWRARGIRAVIKPLLNWILAIPNSRIIIQNPDDIETLRRTGLDLDGRIAFIQGSGVDTGRFSPSPEPQGIPSIVMASRMLWDKGVGEFVEAARLLKKEGIQASFFLVGKTDSDNPSSIPSARIEAWEKEGIIQWQGHQEDMALVFSRAHVACLPSYREGLPKVLLEAAACGRPIVATDVPGCREIVRDGQNGLLVPARNPLALKEALRDLIEQPRRRQEMGLNGRAIVLKEFSVEKVVAETLKVYRTLLSS
jgi:glycosyltransferase involved in cell wall biosynthesis